MKGLFFNVNLQLNFQTELILQLEKVSFFFFLSLIVSFKIFFSILGFLGREAKVLSSQGLLISFAFFFLLAYIINSASFSFASFLFGFAEFST